MTAIPVSTLPVRSVEESPVLVASMLEASVGGGAPTSLPHAPVPKYTENAIASTPKSECRMVACSQRLEGEERSRASRRVAGLDGAIDESAEKEG